jgi:hypothetical protein
LVAEINLNLNDIVDNIISATSSVIKTTAGSATALSPLDLSTLTSILQQIQNLIANIEVSLKSDNSLLPAGISNRICSVMSSTSTDKHLDTNQAIESEIIAVQNALDGFQAPLTTYASQVEEALVATGQTNSGIAGLVASISDALTGFLSNLGLGTTSGGSTSTSTSTSSNALANVLAGLNLKRQLLPGLPSHPQVSRSQPVLYQQVSFSKSSRRLRLC